MAHVLRVCRVPCTFHWILVAALQWAGQVTGPLAPMRERGTGRPLRVLLSRGGSQCLPVSRWQGPHHQSQSWPPWEREPWTEVEVTRQAKGIRIFAESVVSLLTGEKDNRGLKLHLQMTGACCGALSAAGILFSLPATGPQASRPALFLVKFTA